jgi:integrase
MGEEIRVKIIEYADRPHYLMQYTDPMTGKKVSRSTKIERTGKKRERDAAERMAGDWEKQLREGTYLPPSRITWADFRERYETEVLPSLADETGRVLFTVFNSVENIVSPQRLAELTADRLSFYQSELRAGKGSRSGKRSEATIRTYLAHLKAALRWAVDMGLLRTVPKITKPQRAKGSKMMKGRPITGEEFDRMLDRVPAVVLVRRHNPKPAKVPKEPTAADLARDAQIVARWRFYLEGLWQSGLRLAESLELYWDRQDKLCIDTSGKRPMMRIRAELEKGNQDRILPLSPEFAQFLMAVPEAERRGRVFKLVDRAGNPREFGDDWVGRVISAIGKKAGIIVATGEPVKFASAHDLRRSFGARWASRVMPQVLMELMRHESIETTLRYYVGQNAERTADVLWAAHEQQSGSGNKIGNSGSKSLGANEQGLLQPKSQQAFS